MRPGRKLLPTTFGLVLIAAIAIPVFAFSHPLSSTGIRDAYFLGNRRDEQTAEFLAQYAHSLSAPKTGAYVDEIGIDTPFTKIVRVAEWRANYNAPDAVEEFQHKPLSITVYVDISLTSSYSPVSPETDLPSFYQWVPDFWNDFKVNLIQGKQSIAAQSRRGGPLFWYGEGGTPIVSGARIVLDYDPAQIDADPATIEVVTPDGQTVTTTFDLMRLR